MKLILFLYALVISLSFAYDDTIDFTNFIGEEEDDETVYTTNDITTGTISPGQQIVYKIDFDAVDWSYINSHPDLRFSITGWDPSSSYQVRIRKDDENFSDTENNIKKKTWDYGYLSSDELYICDLGQYDTYYLQIYNEGSYSDSITFMGELNNNDACYAAHVIGYIVTAIVVSMLVCCCCCIGGCVFFGVCAGTSCCIGASKRSQREKEKARAQQAQYNDQVTSNAQPAATGQPATQQPYGGQPMQQQPMQYGAPPQQQQQPQYGAPQQQQQPQYQQPTYNEQQSYGQPSYGGQTEGGETD